LFGYDMADSTEHSEQSARGLRLPDNLAAFLGTTSWLEVPEQQLLTALDTLSLEEYCQLVGIDLKVGRRALALLDLAEDMREGIALATEGGNFTRELAEYLTDLPNLTAFASVIVEICTTPEFLRRLFTTKDYAGLPAKLTDNIGQILAAGEQTDLSLLDLLEARGEQVLDRRNLARVRERIEYYLQDLQIRMELVSADPSINSRDVLFEVFSLVQAVGFCKFTASNPVREQQGDPDSDIAQAGQALDLNLDETARVAYLQYHQALGRAVDSFVTLHRQIFERLAEEHPKLDPYVRAALAMTTVHMFFDAGREEESDQLLMAAESLIQELDLDRIKQQHAIERQMSKKNRVILFGLLGELKFGEAARILQQSISEVVGDTNWRLVFGTVVGVGVVLFVSTASGIIRYELGHLHGHDGDLVGNFFDHLGVPHAAYAQEGGGTPQPDGDEIGQQIDDLRRAQTRNDILSGACYSLCLSPAALMVAYPFYRKWRKRRAQTIQKSREEELASVEPTLRPVPETERTALEPLDAATIGQVRSIFEELWGLPATSDNSFSRRSASGAHVVVRRIEGGSVSTVSLYIADEEPVTTYDQLTELRLRRIEQQGESKWMLFTTEPKPCSPEASPILEAVEATDQLDEQCPKVLILERAPDGVGHIARSVPTAEVEDPPPITRTVWRRMDEDEIRALVEKWPDLQAKIDQTQRSGSQECSDELDIAIAHRVTFEPGGLFCSLDGVDSEACRRFKEIVQLADFGDDIPSESYEVRRRIRQLKIQERAILLELNDIVSVLGTGPGSYIRSDLERLLEQNWRRSQVLRNAIGISAVHERVRVSDNGGVANRMKK
jgi:hypothetical protein